MSCTTLKLGLYSSLVNYFCSQISNSFTCSSLLFPNCILVTFVALNVTNISVMVVLIFMPFLLIVRLIALGCFAVLSRNSKGVKHSSSFFRVFAPHFLRISLWSTKNSSILRIIPCVVAKFPIRNSWFSPHCNLFHTRIWPLQWSLLQLWDFSMLLQITCLFIKDFLHIYKTVVQVFVTF